LREFVGKKVLVTGGASGIGRATALAFAREGAELILVDIDDEGLTRVSAEIQSLGGKTTTYTADVTDRSLVEELHRKVTGEVGTPDVVMNAAGIAVVGCAEEITLDIWDRVLAVNLMGYIYVARCFLPAMVERGSGHLVNVASAAGLFGVPYQAPYVTSKFGVAGLSEVLRWELARHGIGVSVVCPGAIKTPIIESATCFGFDEEKVRKGAHVLAAGPDRMADTIVRGVRKNRATIVFPCYVRLLWGTKRFSPRLADVIGKAFARLFYYQNYKG
jgi:NAD(P)-dependent dehydrogenase (short-subunit alcohol dehydrogenase family)